MYGKKPDREMNTVITSRLVEAARARQALPWHGVPPARSVDARGVEYRGINVLLLALAAQEAGYETPVWLTYRQVRKAAVAASGGDSGPRQDTSLPAVFMDPSEATEIVLWRPKRRGGSGQEPRQGAGVQGALMRSCGVYNIAQCAEGIRERVMHALPGRASDMTPIDVAHEICSSFSATHVWTRAPRGKSPGVFYSDAFRGMIQTVTQGRGVHHDLVVDLGAWMLAAEAGIEYVPPEVTDTKLTEVFRTMDADHRMMVRVAGQAQRAVDYVFGRSFDLCEEEFPEPGEQRERTTEGGESWA